MRKISGLSRMLTFCTLLVMVVCTRNAGALTYTEMWLPAAEIQMLYSHEQLTLQLRDSTASAFHSAGSFIDSSSFNSALGVTEYHVNGDIMESLLSVFKLSIEQTASDKGYFLERLAEMNKIGDALGAYLEELASELTELTGQSSDPCQQETASTIKQLMETNAIAEISTVFSSQESVSLADINSILEAKGLSFRLTDDVNQSYPAPVPEPASMILVVSGLLGLIAGRKMFTKKDA